MAPPLILLPTSERVAPGGGSSPGPALDPALAAWRRALWREAGARPGRALLPAYERYTGVLWEWLDPASLPRPALRRLLASVAVVSPTHGPIALALVRREAAVGETVDLEGGATATVVDLPFG